MKNLLAFTVLAVAALHAQAEAVGDVSTTFRWIGAKEFVHPTTRVVKLDQLRKEA